MVKFTCSIVMFTCSIVMFTCSIVMFTCSIVIEHEFTSFIVGVPSAWLECCAYVCLQGIYWYISSWLMLVYARDILSGLPQLLASCTAVFSLTLKIDSTKKVCKKLQGMPGGSASW